MGGVERVLHGLSTGLLTVPPGVDPGDFILSGGTLKERPQRARRRVHPLRSLVEEYLANQAHKARSSVYTEGIHLGNLLRHPGPARTAPRTGSPAVT
jgi:hypothetical protein